MSETGHIQSFVVFVALAGVRLRADIAIRNPG